MSADRGLASNNIPKKVTVGDGFTLVGRNTRITCKEGAFFTFLGAAQISRYSLALR